MVFPKLPFALMAGVLLAMPFAAADGAHDETVVYDPLVLSYEGYFAADTITRTAPSEDAVVFSPGNLVAPPPALLFEFAAPVTFRPAQGFNIELVVEASEPMVAIGPDERSFHLEILLNGTKIEGADARVRVADPVLQAGQPVRLDVLINAPNQVFEKGAQIAVSILPLMPLVAPDALTLLVGPEGSQLSIPDMRVPTVADLGLDNRGLKMFHLETELYVPSATSVAYDVRVFHDAVHFGAVVVPAGTRVVLIFKGEESGDAAHSHDTVDSDARDALAHEFFVGAQRVLVHPGVGVVVPVTSDVEAVVSIICGNQCPEPGYQTVIRFQAPAPLDANGLPTQPVRDDGGLIPPPRDTSGIPVSQDEDSKAERAIPGAAGSLVAILLGFVALASRRRAR